jgi:fucose permease
VKKGHVYLILAISYLFFFISGVPDGAFGVLWPMLMEDMSLPLEYAGIMIMSQLGLYAVVSSQLGFLSSRMKIQTIILCGMILMFLGVLGTGLSPNLVFLSISMAFIGIGAGMADPSISSYMAQSPSARHLNWLSSVQGLGSAVAPIFLSQMIVFTNWRIGYSSFSIVLIVGIVLIFISIAKRSWDEPEESKTEEVVATSKKYYLTKKHHKVMELVMCVMQGGIEFSIAIWIPTIMIESRGIDFETVGLFPAVYFAFITGGRFVSGYFATKFSDTLMIRFGFVFAIAGVVVLMFSNSIVGMALMGIGFAPIVPSMIHDTSNRFSPKILVKLIGFVAAAFGAGGAIISSLMGQLLSRVSLEAMFPAILVLSALVLTINEALEKIAKKLQKRVVS